MSQSSGSADQLASLRGLCEHLPNAGAYQIVRSPSGTRRFTFVGSGVERILELDRRQLLEDAEAFFSRIVADDRKTLETAEAAAIETGATIDLLLRFRIRSDLRQLQLRAIPTPLPDGGARIDGLLLDIAGRQRYEQALRVGESRFRAFMDHSPTTAWMKDADGRYVYVSRVCENRFGRPLDEWIGKSDFDLWPAELARQYQSTDALALSQNQSIQTEERGLDPDGSTPLWWIFKFPFTDTAGNRYVGGIGIDVTERERTRTELRKKNEELQAALDEVLLLKKSLVTMCAWTRRISMDGRWVPVEEFLKAKFGVQISHGISEEALRNVEWGQPYSDVSAQNVEHEADPEQKPGDADPPTEPLA
jgi:PAS domain S-box-containing protein